MGARKFFSFFLLSSSEPESNGSLPPKVLEEFFFLSPVELNWQRNPCPHRGVEGASATINMRDRRRYDYNNVYLLTVYGYFVFVVKMCSN